MMARSIILNIYKHHTLAIRDFVLRAEANDIMPATRVIGSSHMDLYTGSLGITTIRGEIAANLKSPMEPKAHRHGRLGYDIVLLSDGSGWVLRHLDSDTIHIHPGRRSLYTFRVVAPILKTAIASAVCYRRSLIPDLGLNSINEARATFLSLPPLRYLRKVNEILKLLRLP